MARYDSDQLERRRAEEEALIKRSRDNATSQYGEELGNAFHDYAFGKPESLEEQDIQRRNFARNVVLVLESGNRQGKIDALNALLSAVEAKIAPVAHAAYDASRRNMPIGSKA